MTSLQTHTASGQALGYFFQLERALYWLTKAPADSLIGIETEDDVAVYPFYLMRFPSNLAANGSSFQPPGATNVGCGKKREGLER